MVSLSTHVKDPRNPREAQEILDGAHFGAKSKMLTQLVSAGFPVPPFVAISASSVQALGPSDESLESLAEAIRVLLPASTYALRSSGLGEDDEESSLAGCFHSEVNVSPQELLNGLRNLFRHSRNQEAVLQGQFSCFVQTFIHAEYSGICFTRDPRGAREMVIEYAKGPCSALVSGEILPERFRRFHQSSSYSHRGKDFGELSRLAERIERHFNFPQDIEWCEKEGQWYILQSRAITSISRSRAEALVAIDELLRDRGPTLLERTGVSEIAPHPCPLTYSLLRFLYRSLGPVDLAYKRLGIVTNPRDFLELVLGELYVNRLEERRSLFPATAFTAEGTFRLHLWRPREYLRSIWNSFRFQRMRIPDTETLSKQLEKALVDTDVRIAESESDLAGELQSFSSLYELVFAINLSAEIALKRLHAAMTLLCPEFLNIIPDLLLGSEGRGPAVPTRVAILGNCLDFQDESSFQPLPRTMRDSSELTLRTLPSWKQKYLHPLILQASSLSRMREEGRWLALLGREGLRRAVLRLGRVGKFVEPKDLYQFSLEELLSNQFDEAEGQRRAEAADVSRRFDFPDRISSFLPREEHQKPLGVSPGIARGILLREDELLRLAEVPPGVTPGAEKPILYVPILSPHLLDYFPMISGIIAEKGGLLSHLSILARERGIPVIVHAALGSEGLALGKRLQLDGSQGHIEEILAAPAEEF